MTYPPQQPEPNQQSHVPYGTDPYAEPTPLPGPYPPHQLPPGQPVSPPPYGAQPVYVVQQQPTSGMAVASMVLAIVGLVTPCCSFGIPSILAVIFGHVAMRETKPGGGKSGHGMGVAGLVMGYIITGPAIVWSIMTVVGGGIGAVTGTINPSPTP